MLEYSVIIAKGYTPKNFDYLLKQNNNNRNKPKVDPKITEKYRNYAKSFLKMIQNMKAITIFRNEISDEKDSQYIGVCFDNIPNSNPFKYQTYRFSDHTRNFGDNKFMNKYTFSVDPNEHTFNEADANFRHYYNINMGREQDNEFKLLEIYIRKQNPVNRINNKRITNRKEFNYYVTIVTSEAMYYGASSKGATSAIKNAYKISNNTYNKNEPLSDDIKKIVLKDLDEKIKELNGYNNEETKLSSIVKMPNEQLTVQELLSNIIHLFNKKVL